MIYEIVKHPVQSHIVPPSIQAVSFQNYELLNVTRKFKKSKTPTASKLREFKNRLSTINETQESFFKPPYTDTSTSDSKYNPLFGNKEKKSHFTLNQLINATPVQIQSMQKTP